MFKSAILLISSILLTATCYSQGTLPTIKTTEIDSIYPVSSEQTNLYNNIYNDLEGSTILLNQYDSTLTVCDSMKMAADTAIDKFESEVFNLTMQVNVNETLYADEKAKVAKERKKNGRLRAFRNALLVIVGIETSVIVLQNLVD